MHVNFRSHRDRSRLGLGIPQFLRDGEEHQIDLLVQLKFYEHMIDGQYQRGLHLVVSQSCDGSPS